MNTKFRPAAVAVATAFVVASLSSGAVAQPATDVYAKPGTQAATNLAEAPANVTRAPVPGVVVAYKQTGPSGSSLSTVRPVVVAAPYVGRGQVDSAGKAIGYTGLVAGN